MWTCLFGVYFLILLVLQVKSTKDLLCDVQPIQDSFSRIFNSFEDFSKPQNVDELLEFYEKNQLKIKEVNEVIDEEFDFQPNHSVSKVQFLFKNYKFLKSLKNGQFLFVYQNWLFLAVKIRNSWIFAPKIGQKMPFHGFNLSNFSSKSRFCGPKVLIFDTF